VTFIFPRSWLSGLILSAAGGTTTFGVTAGQCADSTNAAIMNVPTALSKTVSGNWSAGNGGGALDTGSTTANTWYHVFAISDAVGVTTDILVSLSPTAPMLPAGFTLFRRIGAMKTDGSFHWTAFAQFGDEFFWPAPPQDLGTTVGAGSTVLITLTVPSGVAVEARLDCEWTSSASATDSAVSIQPTFVTSFAVQSLFSVGAGNPVAGQFRFLTNVSRQIQAQGQSQPGTLTIWTLGWRDQRGKDG
jgi:hypothetical protein